MGGDFSCCRLVFGEADGLPGLTVDRFSDLLSVQIASYGMDKLKDTLYPLLIKILAEGGDTINGIYERNDIALRSREGLEEYKGWYEKLPHPDSPVTEITENGIKYLVDVENGQKTGFFLDQKYNRLAVASISRGKRVLDCFTHTGSFALNAAMGGAEHVTAVDVSETAVEMARRNAERNGLDGRMDFLAADVFDLLPELEKNGKKPYDFIILDPPAFTKSRRTVGSAERGYKEINYRAMKLLLALHAERIIHQNAAQRRSRRGRAVKADRGSSAVQGSSRATQRARDRLPQILYFSGGVTMFYENWMSYIKDDAKLTNIAIPGSHNAGTRGMVALARCQNGTLPEQYCYGVRKFGIRIKAGRNGKLYIAHGLAKGITADEAFRELGSIVDKYDDFMILDIRTYPGQGIGPFRFEYSSDPKEIDALIAKYLKPEKYALTDFDDIKNVTLGDIRREGKKYIILSSKKEYEYSCDCQLLEPWDPKIFGSKPEVFAKECVNYLRELETEGFFWLQTQQTPNFGTDVGLSTPKKLDELSRLYFPSIMEEIAADPVLIEKLNIVAGDFMTRDHMKANEILYFNLLKGVVKDELIDEYAAAIGK